MSFAHLCTWDFFLVFFTLIVPILSCSCRILLSLFGACTRPRPQRVEDATLETTRQLSIRSANRIDVLTHRIDQIERMQIHYRRPESVKITDEPNEAILCIVCTERPRSVLTLPCRHLVMCAACLNRLYEKGPVECPMCRGGIGTTHVAILS